MVHQPIRTKSGDISMTKLSSMIPVFIFDKVGFSQKNATKNATGVSDESYETHKDDLKSSITTTHNAAEAARSTAVGREEASNAWRGGKPVWGGPSGHN